MRESLTKLAEVAHAEMSYFEGTSIDYETQSYNSIIIQI